MRFMAKKFRGLGLLRDRIEDDRDIEMSEMQQFKAKVWAESIMTCVMAEHMTVDEVRKGKTPCVPCTSEVLDAVALGA